MVPTTSRSVVRRGGSGRRGGSRLPEKSSSFNGRSTATVNTTLGRPRTHPDLLAAAEQQRRTAVDGAGDRHREGERRAAAKMLVKVDVQRGLGALQVMASTEWSVEDLVATSLDSYVKERRRPLLQTRDPSGFGLHYSSFSLQCLDPKEKLVKLGSRNFFLCPKTAPAAPQAATSSSAADGLPPASSVASCSDEAKKETKMTTPWHRFIRSLF